MKIKKFLTIVKPIESSLELEKLDNFNNFVINTNEITNGDIFCAFVGKNIDGHEFILEANQKGAAFVLIDNEKYIKKAKSLNINYVYVTNVLEAIQKYAKYIRAASVNTKFIGITGSIGKTSTRYMLFDILNYFGFNSATAKNNFNNHIGVALTLCNLGENIEYSVMEYGISHPSDIELIANIGEPEYVIITRITAAHIENFNMVEEIAKEKIKLVTDKTKILLLDANDEYYFLLKEEALKINSNIKIISFSSNIEDSTNSDSYIKNFERNSDNILAEVIILGMSYKYKLSNIYFHKLLNSLICLTLCSAIGLEINNILDKLVNLNEIEGRGNLVICDNFTIINDSYNASFESMKAGLENLQYRTGYKIAIIGDMLGIGGELSKKMHEDLEYHITNIDKLILIGQDMLYLYHKLSNKNFDIQEQNTLSPSRNAYSSMQHLSTDKT